MNIGTAVPLLVMTATATGAAFGFSAGLAVSCILRGETSMPDAHWWLSWGSQAVGWFLTATGWWLTGQLARAVVRETR